MLRSPGFRGSRPPPKLDARGILLEDQDVLLECGFLTKVRNQFQLSRRELKEDIALLQERDNGRIGHVRLNDTLRGSVA